MLSAYLLLFLPPYEHVSYAMKGKMLSHTFPLFLGMLTVVCCCYLMFLFLLVRCRKMVVVVVVLL